MRSLRIRAGAWLLPLLLVACGGGDDDAPSYSSVVTFGDSLSDVGTYRTAGMAALGGGKFTVNDGDIWVELVAKDRGLTPPCAAEIGLESSGAVASLAQASSFQDACFGYAQGGARVTNPIGPNNKALLLLGSPDGQYGQLTVPVATQVARHLAKVGGRFSGGELVLVLAGGNDVFMNLAAVGAAQITPTDAVVAMATAGGELAAYVRSQLVGNGARHVVVVNLPDVSQTPFAYSLAAPTQGLIAQMSIAFNVSLANGLNDASGVLLVDAYSRGREQVANPGTFGVTNVTTPACDLAATALNGFVLGSLGCSETTLIAGDVSHYQFADGVHPTPYGHQLLANYVLDRMSAVGWR